MGLLNLFRPKWKHSRAEVRLAAVRELGEDETATLADIARADPDAKIRETAMRKLANPALLVELAREERDAAVRGLIDQRVSDLSLRQALDAVDDAAAVVAVERITSPKALADVIRKAASSAARHRALLRLDDARALAEVAQKADDPQMRIEALAKISEPKVLRDLALGEATKAVQLLAIERLSDTAALQQVAERGRNKAVRQAAKEKLAALGGAVAKAPKEPKQKRVDPTAEARLKQRKIEAEMRRNAEASRKQTVQDKKARLEAEHNERLQRLETEEAAQKTAAAARVEERRSGDALVDDLAKNAARDERIRREASPEELARKAAQDAERVEREADKARKHVERAAQAKENAEQLESLAARLESLAAGSDVKEAGATLKEAQASQAARGPLPDGSDEIRARFEAARKLLSTKLGELREAEDWRRFANLPKIEALVVRSESLAKVVIGAIKLDDGQELDARKVSRELRAMQQEWKSFGRPPREKAEQLWERFKAACDIIYEGNKQGLDSLDEERQANLKMKEELCGKVEALVAESEAQGATKQVSDQIKQLQEDWKKIGPVPKSDNDVIWQRFRGACDKFFTARKLVHEKTDAERGEALGKQLELVAKAEALRESTDWNGTADKLKALQDQWKALGPGPGRGKSPEGDEAWKKLRTACDHFFDRRKAHFAEQDEARDENLKKKELLVAEATRLAEGDDVVDADAKIRELMTEWKKVGPVAKDKGDDVWARFGKALDALRAPPSPPPEVVAAASGGKFENKALADKLRPPEPSTPIAKAEPVMSTAKAEPIVAPTAKPEPVMSMAKAEPIVAPTAKPEPVMSMAKAEPIVAPTAKPEPVMSMAKAEPIVAPNAKAEPIVAPTAIVPAPTVAVVAAAAPAAPAASSSALEQDAWPAPEAWTLPDEPSKS